MDFFENKDYQCPMASFFSKMFEKVILLFMVAEKDSPNTRDEFESGLDPGPDPGLDPGPDIIGAVPGSASGQMKAELHALMK